MICRVSFRETGTQNFLMLELNGTSKMNKNGSLWKTVKMNLAAKKKEEELPVMKKVLYISKDKG